MFVQHGPRKTVDEIRSYTVDNRPESNSHETDAACTRRSLRGLPSTRWPYTDAVGWTAVVTFNTKIQSAAKDGMLHAVARTLRTNVYVRFFFFNVPKRTRDYGCLIIHLNQSVGHNTDYYYLSAHTCIGPSAYSTPLPPSTSRRLLNYTRN